MVAESNWTYRCYTSHIWPSCCGGRSVARWLHPLSYELATNRRLTCQPGCGRITASRFLIAPRFFNCAAFLRALHATQRATYISFLCHGCCCCVCRHGMTMKGVVNSCMRVHVLSAASLPRSRGGHEDSSWFVEAEVGFCMQTGHVLRMFVLETESFVAN